MEGDGCCRRHPQWNLGSGNYPATELRTRRRCAAGESLQNLRGRQRVSSYIRYSTDSMTVVECDSAPDSRHLPLVGLSCLANEPAHGPAGVQTGHRRCKRPKLPSYIVTASAATFAEAIKCPLVFKCTLQAPVPDGFQAVCFAGWRKAARFQGGRSPMRLTVRSAI